MNEGEEIDPIMNEGEEIDPIMYGREEIDPIMFEGNVEDLDTENLEPCSKNQVVTCPKGTICIQSEEVPMCI
uniref:Uncharacterized protein n=1 Tax=Lepeophtheirus salmonis TaxID=72036 RepID=A0A0K2U996_LEPSM